MHRGCWCLGVGIEAIRHEATYLSILSSATWTSFASHCSEKATMAFQVGKSSHNSRTKYYFANPQIAIQENMTRSLWKLLLSLQLSLSSCSTLHTHKHTTYTSLAHAHNSVQSEEVPSSSDQQLESVLNFFLLFSCRLYWRASQNFCLLTQ